MKIEVHIDEAIEKVDYIRNILREKLA